MCITESLCCVAETHTTLKINYTSIRFFSKGRPTTCCSFWPITVSNNATVWAPRHRDKHKKASAHKVTGAASVSKSKVQGCMSAGVRYTEKYINWRSRRTPLSVAQLWFRVSLDCGSIMSPEAQHVQTRKACRGCQLWAPVSGPRPWGLKAPLCTPEGGPSRLAIGSKALFFYLDGDLVGSFLSISWWWENKHRVCTCLKMKGKSILTNALCSPGAAGETALQFQTHRRL